MRSICLLLIVVLGNVNADGQVWLKDFISDKGWDLGYGVVLKLNESHKGKDVPLTERLSLDLNLGDLVGVSVGKSKSDGVELDFYVKKGENYQVQEGRGKKDEEGGKYMIPMVMGYKAALLITGMFGMMKLLTMKAIFLAKTALLISLFVLLMKLKHHPAEVIEVEQHEYPSHVPVHFAGNDYGGSNFHGFVGGGAAGGSYGGTSGGGGGGGSYSHTYEKDAQSSNAYQDVVYAPSAQGSTVSESTQYIPVTHNEHASMLRPVERENVYYEKMIGANGGNSNLVSGQKYVSPES